LYHTLSIRANSISAMVIAGATVWDRNPATDRPAPKVGFLRHRCYNESILPERG